MIGFIIYVAIMLACSVGCFLLGRFISRGQGDSFIAGYNTASKEERAQYDIVRLRRLTSAVLYGVAVLMPLFCLAALLPEPYARVSTLVLVAVICVGPIVAAIWCNRWVKKK